MIRYAPVLFPRAHTLAPAKRRCEKLAGCRISAGPPASDYFRQCDFTGPILPRAFVVHARPQEFSPEERHQTPPRQDQFTLARLSALSNDGLVRRRSYVVVRFRHGQVSRKGPRTKMFSDVLFITRSDVSATHQVMTPFEILRFLRIRVPLLYFSQHSAPYTRVTKESWWVHLATAKVILGWTVPPCRTLGARLAT